MGEMLSVKNINVYYGSIHAIKDVSFHVNEGEIVTLIGANGAGKTTTMHAISGLLKLQSGEIDYCGQTISKMEAHKIIRLGLAQVPEGRRVFSGLTVQQNLQMGAYTRRDGKEAIQNDYDMVFDLLPRLKERRNQPAGTLSGGEQQMLAMGRALMCKPKMLLLDEPSIGLSPLLVKEIFKIIRQVNRNGVTVLLVEQNAKMALEIANRAYVLETGTPPPPPIKMEGEATELASIAPRNIEVLPLINPHAYLIALHRQQPHKPRNQLQQRYAGPLLHQIARREAPTPIQPPSTPMIRNSQLRALTLLRSDSGRRDQQQRHAAAGQPGCQTLEGRYFIRQNSRGGSTLFTAYTLCPAPARTAQKAYCCPQAAAAACGRRSPNGSSRQTKSWR